jgi:hypothetical protein
VNTRKLLAMMTALLMLGASAFAEIKLKDLGNGKVAITFLFKHPASEMNVIGTFDNWTVPGEPMTKNADGVWEYTLEALKTDEIQYKFYSKGTWIFDADAPDKKDDGYGGNNGLIVVADILSGVTPIKPGAAAVAMSPSSGSFSARQKVQFGTETYIENATGFNTISNTFLQNVLNAKSIWKLSGDLVPKLPANIEITAFNGQAKITDKFDLDTTVKGLETMSSGFLYNPFYYLGGNNKPYLDKLAFGIDGAWLQWKTGYMNSTLPERKSILWNTVTDDIIAGKGYSLFRLGEDLRELGPIVLDTAIMPNKSLNEYFGYLYWLRASAYGITADFQYDMRSNEKTDASLYFDKAMRQDYIGGLEVIYFDYVFRGQYLLSRFAPGGAIDSSDTIKRSAYKAVAGFENEDLGLKAHIYYSYRGDFAQLLYGKSDDELGTVKTQTIGVDFSKNSFNEIWGAFEASAVLAASDNNDKNIAISGKISFGADLGIFQIFPVVVDIYAKPFYNTSPAQDVAAFGIRSAGAKAVFEKFNVYYKFDNSTTNCMLNSLLADTTIIPGMTLQAGAGLRTGSAAKTNAAFAIGVYKIINAPMVKSPAVYAQFMYNMDPYEDTANYELKLNDYGPNSGPAALDGQGKLNIGIKWMY